MIWTTNYCNTTRTAAPIPYNAAWWLKQLHQKNSAIIKKHVVWTHEPWAEHLAILRTSWKDIILLLKLIQPGCQCHKSYPGQVPCEKNSGCLLEPKPQQKKHTSTNVADLAAGYREVQFITSTWWAFSVVSSWNLQQLHVVGSSALFGTHSSTLHVAQQQHILSKAKWQKIASLTLEFLRRISRRSIGLRGGFPIIIIAFSQQLIEQV